MSRLVPILAVAAVLSLAVPAAAQERPRTPAAEFAKGVFHHGMPFAAAERYGPEDVAPLTALLKDETASEYWANTVWLLGIIGSEEAEVALIDFLENRFEGLVDTSALQALILVNQALGFRAHDPETRAFRYLAEGTDPAAWRSRALRWTYKDWPEGAADILMAKLSVNGLGLAGNGAARGYLEGLAGRLPEEQPELWRLLEPNVVEAIEQNRRIERLGYLRALSPNGPEEPDQKQEAPQ